MRWVCLLRLNRRVRSRRKIRLDVSRQAAEFVASATEDHFLVSSILHNVNRHFPQFRRAEPRLREMGTGVDDNVRHFVVPRVNHYGMQPPNVLPVAALDVRPVVEVLE